MNHGEDCVIRRSIVNELEGVVHKNESVIMGSETEILFLNS